MRISDKMHKIWDTNQKPIEMDLTHWFSYDLIIDRSPQPSILEMLPLPFWPRVTEVFHLYFFSLLVYESAESLSSFLFSFLYLLSQRSAFGHISSISHPIFSLFLCHDSSMESLTTGVSCNCFFKNICAGRGCKVSVSFLKDWAHCNFDARTQFFPASCSCHYCF